LHAVPLVMPATKAYGDIPEFQDSVNYLL